VIGAGQYRKKGPDGCYASFEERKETGLGVPADSPQEKVLQSARPRRGKKKKVKSRAERRGRGGGKRQN